MKTKTKKVFRHTAAFVLCAAVFATFAFCCFGADAAVSGIDWGNGVTTAVVLEWAAYIGGCLAAIFVLTFAAVVFVLEKKE